MSDEFSDKARLHAAQICSEWATHSNEGVEHDPQLADAETERIWQGQRSRKLPHDIQKSARRKMRTVNAVARLDELAVPRGSRLKQLKGFMPPRYSVRINDQWRICFRWDDGDEYDVGIEDYHSG